MLHYKVENKVIDANPQKKDFKLKRIKYFCVKKFWLSGQGSKGIRQWLINWCAYQMIILKITPSIDYN